MTGPLEWTDHEAWLGGSLERLGSDEPRTPLAISFNGGLGDWLVDGRPERRGDEVDPLTELAVVMAELAPDAAALATPTRMRDLDTPDAEVVSRVWLVTSLTRRGGGEGYDLRARMLPVGGVGHPSDVDVELSPVASVLDDAVRHPLGASPQHALYAAAKWGHRLFVAGLDEEDLGTRPTDGRGRRGRSHEAEATSHRLRRHARDLAARHLPTAPWPQALRRPATHASTPDGWEPACPI